MTDLDARYGRTRARTPREKRLGLSVGLGVLLIAVAWVWWVGTDPASTQLQSRTIGYDVQDESTVVVAFEVSVDAGTAVSCAIEALNSAYGVVGWVELDLPPSDALTTSERVAVRTSEKASTGLVSQCWVTYDGG